MRTHTSPNTNSDYNYSFSFCGSRVTVKTLLLIASLLLLYCTRYFWVQSTELANLRNAVQCAKSQPISATATVTKWCHGNVKQVTITMRRISTVERTRMIMTTVTASPTSERPCHPEIRHTDAGGFVHFTMDARSKCRETATQMGAITLTAATETLEVTVTSTTTATVQKTTTIIHPPQNIKTSTETGVDWPFFARETYTTDGYELSQDLHYLAKR
jgi:hypothetical protein